MVVVWTNIRGFIGVRRGVRLILPLILIVPCFEVVIFKVLTILIVPILIIFLVFTLLGVVKVSACTCHVNSYFLALHHGRNEKANDYSNVVMQQCCHGVVQLVLHGNWVWRAICKCNQVISSSATVNSRGNCKRGNCSVF